MKHLIVEKQQVARKNHIGHKPAANLSEAAIQPSLLSLQDRFGNGAAQRVLTRHALFTANHAVGIPVMAARLVQRDEDHAQTASPVNGQTIIETVRYNEYRIAGKTLAAVAGKLGSEWGRCTYDYTYKSIATNGRVTRVDVTLKLVIRIPRWHGKGYNRASPAVQAEWDRMLTALRDIHEEGHAEIARKWAPRIRQELLGQKASDVASCFEQLSAQVAEDQKRYDQQTDHGRAQGVTLDTSIQ